MGAATSTTETAPGWVRSLADVARGRSDLDKLLRLHPLHSAGEAFFAVSLAGSLFFNVSVDAARPRILLYLALTMAPFAPESSPACLARDLGVCQTSCRLNLQAALPIVDETVIAGRSGLRWTTSGRSHGRMLRVQRSGCAAWACS